MAIASIVSMGSMKTRVLSKYNSGRLPTNRVVVYITNNVVMKAQNDVPSEAMNSPPALRSVPASDRIVVSASSTRMVSVKSVPSVLATAPVLMVIPHGVMLTEHVGVAIVYSGVKNHAVRMPRDIMVWAVPKNNSTGFILSPWGMAV